MTSRCIVFGGVPASCFEIFSRTPANGEVVPLKPVSGIKLRFAFFGMVSFLVRSNAWQNAGGVAS